MAHIDFSWECDCSFPDHPKIQKLAFSMKSSIEQAGWALVRLYCRVRRFAPNGDISGVSEATLRDWTGTKKLTFAALAEADLIDIMDGPKRVLHGWPERRYTQKDEKRTQVAAQGRERTRRWRDATRNASRERNGNASPKRTGDVRERETNVTVRTDVDVDVDVDVVPSGTTGTTSVVPSCAGAQGESSSDPSRKSKHPTNPAIKTFIDGWHQSYVSAFGEKPIIAGAQDGATLKRVLKTIPLSELEALRTTYFAAVAAGDKFLSDSVSLSRFLSATVLETLRQRQRAPVIPARRKTDAEELYEHIMRNQK